MALAAPTAIAAVPVSRRGVAGGVIFTGVGLGVVASGTLVPLLMRRGLVATWLGLGALAWGLTVLTWTAWRGNRTGSRRLPRQRLCQASPALRALYLEYALNAVGLVPHMVFLVDFVARGLGRGLENGARQWIIFGAGALVGPLIGGYLGDRIGFRATLRLALLVQMLAVGAPLVAVSDAPVAISSFVVGAFVPGIVAITIGRTRELIPDDPSAQASAWGYCTTAFAIGQAIAAGGFSYVFARTGGGYPVLFGLGAGALLLALVIDFTATFVVAAPERQIR
jgi:predicted MFS family arabinose efflux permease